MNILIGVQIVETTKFQYTFSLNAKWWNVWCKKSLFKFQFFVYHLEHVGCISISSYIEYQKFFLGAVEK